MPTGVETQQLLLREALLRQGARPAAGQERRRGGGYLEKIAPREHAMLRLVVNATCASFVNVRGPTQHDVRSNARTRGARNGSGGLSAPANGPAVR